MQQNISEDELFAAMNPVKFSQSVKEKLAAVQNRKPEQLLDS